MFRVKPLSRAILDWLERGDDTPVSPERAAHVADLQTIQAFEDHEEARETEIANLR
jgi:hypothetical protein